MSKTPQEIAEQTKRVAQLSVDNFSEMPIEKRLVWLLLHDLCDRRDFKQLFSSCSASVQQEIQAVWEEIILAELADDAQGRWAEIFEGLDD